MSASAFVSNLTARLANSSRRLVVVLVSFGLALVALVSPALTGSANAATPHLTANTTAVYARMMLGALNIERRRHGEAPLRMNTDLIRSAHAHNLSMAHANTMSHQLPREAYFADRIQSAGYNWQSAGENIGWNGDASLKGIYYLQRVMYNEKPGADGHRQNILSKSFRDVGIDVYYDAAHHKIWFTQDFGQLMH